jgi:putative multicomponent Na+:H+ antiporter subunit B
MDDSYIYVIIALLPLAAVMLTTQANPYHALVIRGILGAIAALVYAVLGAADVALTEALVGTMLAITLYAVAVRSSLVMRVGILEDMNGVETSHTFTQLLTDLKRAANRYYLRLELVPYPDSLSLDRALMEKEVHATCVHATCVHATCVERSPQPQETKFNTKPQPYHTLTRIRRLYEILQVELSAPVTSLDYITPSDSQKPQEKH